MAAKTCFRQMWEYNRRKILFPQGPCSHPCFALKGKAGYTLVELMVVVAIVGIMTAVAVPAYVNYINRGKQGDAIAFLQHAKMEQDMFWDANKRYACTIGLLASFGNSSTSTIHLTQSGYRIQVDNPPLATTLRYQLSAAKQFAGTWDRVLLTVSAQTYDVRPVVVNPGAMHFSIFEWIFD